MKKLIKKKGIVITSRDYKENARMLTILTPDGLESAILRGANKISSKNKAFAIVPVEVEYITTAPTPLSTFTEGFILSNYTQIKMDPQKSLLFSGIAEKVLMFAENVDNKTQFYDFTYAVLQQLEITQHPHVVLNLFEIKLLYLLGISPILNQCMRCKNIENDYAFSVFFGGTICLDCAKRVGYQLDRDETKIFKYLYLIKMDKVDEVFLDLIAKSEVVLDETIDQYYEKYMDFTSKAKQIIKKVS
ncbi:MAG: DNA repair protein RecO [Prevotella sp.]|nr:DNA repair protein RecO [Staphylococcus sp.]MCM1349804.1 DNA repair protein RecO [Prevotella sp.]